MYLLAPINRNAGAAVFMLIANGALVSTPLVSCTWTLPLVESSGVSTFTCVGLIQYTYAALPLTVTFTFLNWVGILPELNSGAVLQLKPFGPRSSGASPVPLISIQVFCAISEPPPAALMEVMLTALIVSAMDTVKGLVLAP